MSAPGTPSPPKDALYEQGGAVIMTDSSHDSSIADVVGKVAAPLAAQSRPAQDGAVAQAQQPQPQLQPPNIEALHLHDDEQHSPVATAASTAVTLEMGALSEGEAKDDNGTNNGGTCCQCGQPMGSTKGAASKDGPLHPQCIAEYKFLHQPRCRYCNIRFHDGEADSFVKDPATGYLYHPDCRTRVEAGKPFVQPTKEGEVRKFAIARSRLSRHNWKARYFVLSPANGGIWYYADKAAATGGHGGNASDAKSDGSASYDADADPDREAHEAKRAKGRVPLSNRSRLLTRPNFSNYKTSSSGASENDIGIIFFESPDSQKELRLIFQCGSVEERNAWIKALEAYIYTVDDPADYSEVRGGSSAKAKDAEKETEKDDGKKK